MRTTEFMVNDWVCITYKERGKTISKNFQVTQIRSSVFKDEPVQLWCKQDGYEANMGHEGVNGILITEDILRANGFKWNNETGLWERKGVTLMFCYNNGIFAYDVVLWGNFFLHIHYVHELQHLLRLLNYDTVADNFKI